MSKVEHTPQTLPPLTQAHQDDLKRMAAAPNGDMATDDMPELTDAQLAGMRQGSLYRPVKTQITARLDADVLAWLKSQGKGYQSRMNAILRDTMLNAK